MHLYKYSKAFLLLNLPSRKCSRVCRSSVSPSTSKGTTKSSLQSFCPSQRALRNYCMFLNETKCPFSLLPATTTRLEAQNEIIWGTQRCLKSSHPLFSPLWPVRTRLKVPSVLQGHRLPLGTCKRKRDTASLIRALELWVVK